MELLHFKFYLCNKIIHVTKQENTQIKLAVRALRADPMGKFTDLGLRTYLAFYFLRYTNYLHRDHVFL